MARDWAASFASWATAPGTTEQTKSENAVRAVRKAIDASSQLQRVSPTVFLQGSYRNRTNVRTEGDVDVAVCIDKSIFYAIPDGMLPAAFGITTPATYQYAPYKNEVGAALVASLGQKAVSRGTKAFDVHENTYRIDADVVPCFEYRRYSSDGTFVAGTAFVPDGGSLIINWPEQNYTNGVAKNDATGRGFKAAVRILKALRSEMAGNGSAIAANTCSYLIECLVWNVPNEGLCHDNYFADIRHVLAHLWNNTRNEDTCSDWGEINELKYLFRSGQPWKLADVNAFLQAAWTYIGLE